MTTFPLASASSILAVAVQALLPPPQLTISEWATRYRVLSREDSAAPGRWSHEDRPYQQGIMDAVGDPRIEQISVQGGAQWGKTQILNNILGYHIHLDPCPVMVVQPTEKAGEKWSKTRLAPMIRDCPELKALVADPKTRDSGNTIMEKSFPGGLLVVVGANAPTGLASQPVRMLLLDEVDRFEGKVGGKDKEEGDPVDLAMARTLDFLGRRKIYACSTPGVKGFSRIEKRMAESDQRRFFVPCPHCNHEQHLRWKQVVWPTDEVTGEARPMDAVYACEACGAALPQFFLNLAIRNGRWIATRPEVKDHAGFFLNGLYCRSMAFLVESFLKAKHSGVHQLQVFINTALGELWDPRDAETIKAQGLMARREAYKAAVPRGAVLLTAAVDVQDDRLEVGVKGWGPGEESWLIEYKVIPGNPGTVTPWAELDAYLCGRWKHELGPSLGLRIAAIDTGGHFTKETMAFISRSSFGPIIPLKGGKLPRGKVVQRSGKKARLWLVDTVALKDTVFARLRVENPNPDLPCPNVMHFPDTVDQGYFEQLTAEKPVRKRANGTFVRAYDLVTPGARNEALDVEVYNSALLEILGTVNFTALKADLERAAAAHQEEPAPALAAAPGRRMRSPGIG